MTEARVSNYHLVGPLDKPSAEREERMRGWYDGPGSLLHHLASYGEQLQMGVINGWDVETSVWDFEAVRRATL
jgi:hypothetical protein